MLLNHRSIKRDSQLDRTTTTTTAPGISKKNVKKVSLSLFFLYNRDGLAVQWSNVIMTPRVYSSFFLSFFFGASTICCCLGIFFFFRSRVFLLLLEIFWKFYKEQKKDRKQLRTSRVGASESQTHQQNLKKI